MTTGRQYFKEAFTLNLFRQLPEYLITNGVKIWVEVILQKDLRVMQE